MMPTKGDEIVITNPTDEITVNLEAFKSLLSRLQVLEGTVSRLESSASQYEQSLSVILAVLRHDAKFDASIKSNLIEHGEAILKLAYAFGLVWEDHTKTWVPGPYNPEPSPSPSSIEGKVILG